jgi:hypothetical protein
VTEKDRGKGLTEKAPPAAAYGAACGPSPKAACDLDYRDGAQSTRFEAFSLSAGWFVTGDKPGYKSWIGAWGQPKVRFLDAAPCPELARRGSSASG